MTQSLTRVALSGPDDVDGFWRQAAMLDAAGAKAEDVVFELPGETPDDRLRALP